MRALTVIGNDPYDSIQPLLRAQPMSEDGSSILKAEAVEPLEEEAEELPINLGPPPRIFIEDDSVQGG